jgi:cell division protein FtsL
MAGWAAAARSERVPEPRRRPRAARRAPAQRRMTGGVLWIGVLAALLAGVVAMNVAVLRLNMRLDKLSHERDNLRADNAALTSRLSSAAAAGRIQSLAMHRLGFVQATSDQTTFVHLKR